MKRFLLTLAVSCLASSAFAHSPCSWISHDYNNPSYFSSHDFQGVQAGLARFHQAFHSYKKNVFPAYESNDQSFKHWARHLKASDTIAPESCHRVTYNCPEKHKCVSIVFYDKSNPMHGVDMQPFEVDTSVGFPW